MLLVLSERSWWVGFNGIYLVRFGFRMWVISTIGNSNKFQRTKFWKEKSIEDVIKLGPTTQATLVNMNIVMFSNASFSLKCIF
jgi:hypothetical protein